MNRMSQQLNALLLAGIYALVGVLWVFFSDQYSASQARDAYELTHFQTYKGWAFIAVTTLLVYGLIRLAQFHRASHEEKSRRFERMHRLLGDISHAIVQTRNLPDLFQTVCRIAVDEGNFQLVWIGRVNEQRTRLDIAAMAGGGAHLVEALDLCLDPVHDNPCPLTATLLNGKPFLCRDCKEAPCNSPWRKTALKLGYRSVLALPIHMFGELAGAIVFYASKPAAFDEAETQLLETLASDLGMALSHAESEQRWIMAIEGAGHGVWDHNAVTKKTFYSKQWKKILGYEEHEIGDDLSEWSSRIHPDDKALCFEQIERMDRNETSEFRAEYRLRSKDNSYKWILAQGTVFSRDAVGKPLRIVGTDTDITETKSRERAFFEAQKVASIGSYIYDAQLDNWTSTQVLDDIFGIEPDYPRTADGWLKIVRDDYRETMRDYLNKVLYQHQRFDIDYPIVRLSDSTERWVHGLGEVEYDERNAPLRMVGTIRDVTESRRDHFLLKSRLEMSELAQQGRTEELLRLALDRAEDLTGSKIGFFHFVNQDQETLTLQTWSSNTLNHMCKAEGQGLHYPVSEAGVWADCLKSLSPIIHNDYAHLPGRKGLPEGHAEVLRELTVPVVRLGKPVAIAGMGNKAHDYTDADARLLQELAGFVMDLVSNIEAEKFLRQSEAKLRKTTETLQGAVNNLTQLNTELERFAYIASHDLQEPLRNITTYAQLIDKKYRDKVGPEAKEYFDMVVNGAKKMYALINDLMTYSRTTVTTHPFHLISSAQACKSALDNLYSAIQEAQAEVTIGELPSVVGDEIQVMQLFKHLIANSLKFRDPRRKLLIEIFAKRANGSWEFQVKDNGIGFDTTEQDV
ncbi:MAG: GAF domain-containing protein, partial [Rhodospirillales bacterium]